MTQPKLLSKAWASDGLKNDIPADRQAGAAQEAATYSEGFPSITMTPLSLGGKPPSGKDMNGVLHDVSAAAVFLNNGNRYRFDAAHCAAIGGYPKGAVLMADTLDGSYISLMDGNRDNPNSGSAKWARYGGKLSSATNSDSESTAATSKAVKAAYDKATAAQEAVNGISLDWGGITGKPNSLAGYGIGNFKVEAFSGDLNQLKTDGIYAVLSPSQSRNLPAGSRGGKLVAVSGADGRIAHQYWHEAYSTNVWERHKTSMNNEDWSPWIQVQGGTPAVAAGSVMWFAATRPPEGWLVADGSRLLRTAYPALFAAIGTAFNQSGDGAQYFRLPDLRGEFVRGWDGNRGIDSGRAFGSAQGDEFRSHKHALPISGNADEMFENLSDTKRIRVTLVNDSDWNNVFGYHKDDYTASGGTETRPRNIALLPIIKY